MGRKPTRRAVSSGSFPLADQPWYVKTLVWVGAPTAFAAYLLYFLVSVLTGKLDTLNAAVAEHQKDVAALVQTLQAQSATGWQQLSVVQRICLNTAKTDADRIACAIAKGPQ